MKLKEPENVNYAAQIVEITSLRELENSDNLLGAPLLGMQAVVSKDTKVGDVGVVFVAETQLSDEYCLALGTKVLDGRMRYVPIESLSVGDHLVGFDEHPVVEGNRKQSRRLHRTATVTGTEVINRPSYKITFESGKTITASEDHKWLVRPGRWVSTKDLVAGGYRASGVLRLFDEWETLDTQDSGYLAAAFDGEGWISQTGSKLSVGFSQKSNSMYEKVIRIVKSIGIPYTHNMNGDVNQIHINGRKNVARFLGMIQPVRLLDNLTIESMGSINKQSGTGPDAVFNVDRVVSLEYIGESRVVALRTDTSTFIAEGLASHNCSRNGLYRHPEKNEDKDKKGFIEDNRRVRAMKLRGNRSDALFMPLSSLAYTKVDLSKFEIGDVFEELDGNEICKKYEIKRRNSGGLNRNKEKVAKRIDDVMFPRHYDTSQYYRVLDLYKPYQEVIVTQKMHGTLLGVSNILVPRKLSLVEKILGKLGVNIDKYQYELVYRSNRVIKDANNKNQKHYYDSDIWSLAGKRLDDKIPQNFLVYGELIGWTPEGAPIQKDYTYDVPHGENEFYVYRVAQINSQGIVTDLSWGQVKEFCNDRGIKHVPELWRGKHQDFSPDIWLDTRYHDTLHGGYSNAVQLSNGDTVDEGVCIRVDGLAPFITKLKAAKFYEWETKALDDGVFDIEEEEKQNG